MGTAKQDKHSSLMKVLVKKTSAGWWLQARAETDLEAHAADVLKLQAEAALSWNRVPGRAVVLLLVKNPLIKQNKFCTSLQRGGKCLKADWLVKRLIFLQSLRQAGFGPDSQEFKAAMLSCKSPRTSQT